MAGRESILFVCARLPVPANEGHQKRTLGVLTQLAKHFDVHLLSVLREGERLSLNHPELNKICVSVTGVDLPVGLRANIRAVISSLIKSWPLVVSRYVPERLSCALTQKITAINPDIIHLDLLPLAGLMPHIPASIKVVLNEHNIESDLIEQKLSAMPWGLQALVYSREYRLLRRFECWACNAVDHVLACSETDQKQLQRCTRSPVSCIPNGVDTQALVPGGGAKSVKSLVFLGGMSWYPNRLGMIWFLEEVFPEVLKVDPDVQLQLIGNPEPEIAVPEAVRDNVEKLGFVDDFVPLVQQSQLLIVPLHMGSGTRLKVVEGLALGKCMISTKKGAEGIGLTHGKDVLFADTKEEFSAAILKMLANPDKIARIERNARLMADKVYDWNIIGLALKPCYSDSFKRC